MNTGKTALEIAKYEYDNCKADANYSDGFAYRKLCEYKNELEKELNWYKKQFNDLMDYEGYNY